MREQEEDTNQRTNENQPISDRSSSQRCKTKVVLFPLPVKGHITPMLHLANALHSKGLSITIIHTIFNAPHPSHFPHFTFSFISPESLVGASPLEALNNLYAAARSPFNDALAEIEEVGCLIADALWPFTKDVGDELKLPHLVLRTASLFSFLIFDSLPLLLDRGYFSLPDDQLEEPIPEFPPLKVKDLPPKVTHELVVGIVRGVRNSQGVIWNSFEELEGPALNILSQSLHIPSFAIGPLNKYSVTSGSLLSPDKDSLFSWLSSQAPKSVLYVSFGSNSKLTESDFFDIGWGLADSGVPFLWVVRAGMVEGSVPNGFLEVVGKGGYIIQWAPQNEVLAHWAIGGFWTHSGWNSTIESISEGVPLICMPFLFPDQRLNAAYATEVWKIALRIDKGAKREEIARVVRNLMVEKVGEELRETAGLFKNKVDCCLAKGGSSYECLERLSNFIMSL